MKKILFIFLFLSNFLFAKFLIVHNGSTFCANKVKNLNETQITVYHERSQAGNDPFRTDVLNKESITTALTGYSGRSNSCTRNIEMFPKSYDLYYAIKEADIDSKDSQFQNILKNSENIVKDIFTVIANNQTICTTGASQYESYYRRYNYYSPTYEDDKDPSQKLLISSLDQITSAYPDATFNKDSGECTPTKQHTPLNLTEHFNKSDSFSSEPNKIGNRVQNLITLFQTAKELPNQNSLENKFDIDISSSSLNCNNSLYSLQEKLLCEMNAGLRKLNQESNPRYSLNNLISILITSTDKNSEDINQSIKSISAFEEIRLQKQKETNSLLDSTIFKQSQINSTLSNIETTLKGIETNTTGGIVSGGGSSGGTVTPEPEKIDLDKYLKPDENINLDDLNNINNDTDSIITTLFTSFTDFKTNITDSFDSINNQLDGLKQTIQNPTNIFSKNTIINCPVTYKADFSSFGLGQKSLIVDYCEFTSRLQPIVYFFTYVTLLIGLIFFSFRFIGVLL